MARVAARVAWSVAVLLLVSAGTFVIFRVLPPGDPAVLRAGPGAPPELIARVRAELGLERPLTQQYGRWLSDVLLRGDLGVSYLDGTSVNRRIAAALPATVAVAVGALGLGLLSAVGLAVMAARRPGGVVDRLLGIGSFAVFVLPVYLVAIAAMALAAEDVGLVPVLGGAGSYVPLAEDPGGWLRALALPWIVLAIPLAAVHGRLLRAALGSALSEHHVMVARAMGLRERTIVGRRGLRSVAPVLVGALAVDAGALLGGAVVLEVVFELPGLGTLTLDALQRADLPVLEGAVMTGAVGVLAANAVADMTLPLLDPRLRAARAGS